MWDIFSPIERKVLKYFLGICYNKKSTQAAEKYMERAAAP